MFIVVGFAFKVSAVPFHTWAPDTYEGAPTPIAAFLSVASKAAGFVALLALVFVAFPSAKDVWQPLFWVLAALTMTVGNLVALRQTNIVRMFAYSSVAQGGFILMPLAVVGNNAQAKEDALTAVVTYLIIYAAMNLGAFAVVIAVARKTRSGEISSYGGLFDYAPGLAVAMAFFLFSLAGIPPLGGWIAKFGVFRSLLAAGGSWAVILAVIGAVNSVIALFYYANVAREMFMNPVPDGDATPVRVPQAARGRPGHHRRHHAAGRRAAEPGAALRRPLHLPAPAVRSRSRWRRGWLSGSPATARCPTRRSSTPPSTTARTASTPAAASAGRRGDFLTAPRSARCSAPCWPGPSTQWWDELGRPDPFVVVEAGAGPGTLARSVLAAGPGVSAGAALRARGALGRAAGAPRRRPAARHRRRRPSPAREAATTTMTTERRSGATVGIGPLVVSLGELPAVRFTGVVLANELLDNLPFGLVVVGRRLAGGARRARPRRRVRRGAGARRAGRCRPACPPSAAARRPRSRAAGRRRLVARPPSSCWSGAGSWSSTTRRRRRPWPPGRGGSGCAPTGATSGASTRCGTRAPRTSPARWPSTSWPPCRSPTAVRSQAAVPAPSTASTSWWPRGGGRGPSGPTSATSPRCGPAAGSGKPRRSPIRAASARFTVVEWVAPIV